MGENTKVTESFSGDVLCEVILSHLGVSEVLLYAKIEGFIHFNASYVCSKGKADTNSGYVSEKVYFNL